MYYRFADFTFATVIKWCKRIINFINHNRIVFSLFFALLLFSFWAGFATIHYARIPDNEIFDSLVQQTVPNLTKTPGLPDCDYKRIIAENRHTFIDAYRNELTNPSEIRAGGEYIPSDCNPTISTVILVPFRNREDQLPSFLIYIHNYLRHQRIHYRIFLIEQSDDKGFNRAKLFNIGAVYAEKEQFPCLVLHDVDLFPMTLGNIYGCTRLPKHMAVNMDKFRYHLIYDGFFGGVSSMFLETYQLVNGMSNMVRYLSNDHWIVKKHCNNRNATWKDFRFLYELYIYNGSGFCSMLSQCDMFYLYIWQ